MKIKSKLKTFLFGRPSTVSEIVSDFEEKIQHLSHVRDSRKSQIDANNKLVSQIAQENVAHASEATKAHAVAEKLQTLLS